jgi:hypothetical protein
MRRVAFLGVLAGALTMVASAAASDPIILPTGSEGCVSPAGDICTYSPTRDGGYAARGTTWTITVEVPAPAGDTRDTNLDGKLRYVFNSSNAPAQGCGFFGAGSTVTTSGGSDTVAAGNPFPGASDAALGDANNCATGLVAADNPNYTPVD